MPSSIQLSDASFTVAPVGKVFPQPANMVSSSFTGSAAAAAVNLVPGGAAPSIVGAPVFDGVAMKAAFANNIPTGFLDTNIAGLSTATLVCLADFGAASWTTGETLISNFHGTGNPRGDTLAVNGGGSYPLTGSASDNVNGTGQSSFQPAQIGTTVSGQFSLFGIGIDGVNLQVLAKLVKAGAVLSGSAGTLASRGVYAPTYRVLSDRSGVAVTKFDVRIAWFGIWNTVLADADYLVLAGSLAQKLGITLA